MAIMIPVFSPTEILTPEDTAFTLAELQERVGGDIEVVPISLGLVMVIRETGKLDGQPVNAAATHLVRSLLMLEDEINGPALIATDAEMGD